MNTIEMPNIKFMVKVWPNRAAEAIPVKIVATVDEYFFRIVSAHISNATIYLSVMTEKNLYQ